MLSLAARNPIAFPTARKRQKWETTSPHRRFKSRKQKTKTNAFPQRLRHVRLTCAECWEMNPTGGSRAVAGAVVRPGAAFERSDAAERPSPRDTEPTPCCQPPRASSTTSTTTSGASRRRSGSARGRRRREWRWTIVVGATIPLHAHVHGNARSWEAHTARRRPWTRPVARAGRPSSRSF